MARILLAEIGMGGIDIRRWLLSGVVAGVFLWLMEGVASIFYMEEMQATLEAHGLAMAMTAGTWLVTVVVSLVAGITLVFFYAAARPRLGPGPGTAVKVAVPFWLGAYVLPIAGFWLIGLYSPTLLLLWAGVSLVEVLVAGLIGAMLYRERTS